MTAIDKLIQTADNEVGYLEKSSNSQLDDKTAQQRTAALSLKLAQIQLMREVMKESPILLLDDVLSELDSNRKTYLLESIKDTQTIITCTGLDEFISKHLPIQRMFQIKAGKIVKEN